MSTKVFVMGCKLSKEARGIIEKEMEMGRRYYNTLIADVNLELVGDLEWSPEKEALLGRPQKKGKAKRIEDLAKLICGGNEAKARDLAARALYRFIARVSRDVRAKKKNSAANSGCYTGTYHSVHAAFDQAMSAKRIGIWPGEPYHYRRYGQNSGALVGVHLQPASAWGKLLTGYSSICAPEKGDGRRFKLMLKVAKSHAPVEISVDVGNKCRGVRREIPPDALVSHVMLARKGDYATGGKYVVLVTLRLPEAVGAVRDITQRVGIDVGFEEQADGSLLVATASDGTRLVIPAYAIRMAKRTDEIQGERDLLANKKKAECPDCPAKSAYGVAKWCEEHGPGHLDYLEQEHALHCTQDHVRRRHLFIRKDIYRKFARVYGPNAYVRKTKLKEASEGELYKEEDNYVRKLAGLYELEQLLRSFGAVDVNCIRPSGFSPTRDNAMAILVAGDAGSLKAAKKKSFVRAYRKRAKSDDMATSA